MVYSSLLWDFNYRTICNMHVIVQIHAKLDPRILILIDIINACFFKLNLSNFFPAGWWFFKRRWYCFISPGFFFQLTSCCSVLYKLNIACYFQDVVERAFMVENFQVTIATLKFVAVVKFICYLLVTVLLSFCWSFLAFHHLFYRWKLQANARSAWCAVNGKFWTRHQWVPIFYNIQASTTS